jgi:alpha-tubulin suppressor-like RCC1 family protein
VISISDGLTFSFGSVTVGFRAAKMFTVTNISAANSTLGMVSTSGLGLGAPFTLDGGTCTTATILSASGGSCTLTVEFSPATNGSFSDAIDLSQSSALGDAGASRGVSGVGLSLGSLVWSIGSSYDFGSVAFLGSAAKTLIASNVGESPATLGTVSTAGLGLAAPFSFDGGTCVTGGVLGGDGGSCDLSIVFAPTGLNESSDSANLAYANAVTDASAPLAISGKGAVPGLATISDGPTYPFGNVAIGARPVKTFVVTNIGGAPSVLAIVSSADLGLATPYALDGGTCATGLSVGGDGGTCTLAVEFAPTVSAAVNDTIELGYWSGVSNATATRPMTAIGQSPAVLTWANSPVYDFGTVVHGNRPTFALALQNSGGATATLGTVSEAALGLGTPFAYDGGTCTTSGPVVGDGGSCTVMVQFAPTEFVPVFVGGADASVNISYSDGVVNQQAARDLKGTGIPPAMVVQVVGGRGHTCALLSTGKVRCWGRNDLGQCGYAHTSTVTNPAAAGDVNVGGDVIQLSAGVYHTCALLSTGNVRCWGFGSFGVLGYGNTNSIGDNEHPYVAGDVNVGGKVVYISSRGNESSPGSHTCAVLSTGKLRCWGYNGNGQLGYGNYYNIGDTETPASAGDVPVGGDVIQVAAGSEHACALLSTGRVRCWGYGLYGQLGYGNVSSFLSPGGDVSVGGDVVQLAAGQFHTCALLSTGAVSCWGGGSYGRLGYGNPNTIGDNELPSNVGPVSVGGNVIQITAGDYHTCALLANRRVKCWGYGALGSLGYGNTNDIGDNEFPSSVGEISLGGDVVAIASGHYHTCAVLANGRIRCWGYNDYYQLGYGNTVVIGDTELPSSVGPVDLGASPSYGAIAVAAGSGHSCMVLGMGRSRCWGAGANGALGYGNTNDIGDNEVLPVAGYVSVGDAGIVQIAAGTSHTCAVLSDGTVRCWGAGENGRLGQGNTDAIGDNEVPAAIGTVNVGDGGVVQVVAGEFHTCARLATGRVRCWGGGAFGQLGYANLNDIGDNELPWTAGDVNLGDAGAVQVAVGRWHSCALLATGSVTCWGYAGFGQLGYGNMGTIGDNEFPVDAGRINIGDAGARSIAVGGSHTCAVLATGEVRCWGFNTYGQLGLGNMNSYGDDEVPAEVAIVNVGDGGVVQIAAGEAHTCALLATRNVRCWGQGANGRLGYGDGSNIGDNELPWTVGDVNLGDAGVVSIAAGGSHTCARLATGAVVCWGAGTNGRLGYGNVADIGDNELPSDAGTVRIE